ncbi:adenosylcobinamide-GDP ribazoletransferase [Beijerinckia mobilis]|uniref:adenosylcobinamide-GDP ribazoletransferase n=1 Tax=Beijerinckia mobilis TaxID=231434 RepID=UPI00054D9DF8|nr:adenosylcobinamide-GDP ribazoletransferase [Beijerinckia mobilis]
MRPSKPFLNDVAFCLRFYTRLPVPALPGEYDPHGLESGFGRLKRAVRALPAAGAVVGALGGFVLLAAGGFGLGPWLAAPLSILAMILMTGGLHEDGLADCADGFGGGRDVARKLEIMRDSRLGSYGVLALILAVWLRIASLATLAETSLGLAVTVLIASAALSRTLALIPLLFLPPARSEGSGFSVGRPHYLAVLRAFALSGCLGFLPLFGGAGFFRCLGVLFLGFIASCFVAFTARAQIRGQTGDVAGATQQVVEIVCLLLFAAHS